MNEINEITESFDIKSKIHTVRDKQVMLGRDLALLYGVENRALKQAVKRNIEKFSNDFMFILNDSEIDMMVSQNVIPQQQQAVTGLAYNVKYSLLFLPSVKIFSILI